MKTKKTLYSILDKDARAWWWYKELRRKGKVSEARKKERESIKSTIKSLRECLEAKGYLSIGRGGFTLYCGNSRVQGYGDTYFKAAMIAGIPVLDTRTISDENITKAVNLPLAAINRTPDEAPYGSFDYAPIAYVFSQYCALGATLHNYELEG